MHASEKPTSVKLFCREIKSKRAREGSIEQTNSSSSWFAMLKSHAIHGTFGLTKELLGDVMTRESLEAHLVVKGFETKEEAEKACKSLSSAWNTMNQKTGRDRSSGLHYGYWHLYVAREGQPAYKVVVEDPDAVTFEPHMYFDKETAEQDAQAWKERKKTSKVTFTEIERPPMWEYHMLTQNAIQESATLSELSSDTKAQFEKLISL
jgi:heme oxygenase